MTQEELAAKLGYKNKSSIAKIETGTNDIVQSKVVEFANALNTTVPYLMGWDDGKGTNMADKIKERRLACGYTQEELADKLGLQKSAVAKYENGRVENIKRSTIEKMSKILDCSPAYLMGWNDDKAQNTTKLPQNTDIDMTIIQRERSKMSDREKTKLMNILKANFDDFNWEEDDSGDIE